ncbi:DUF2528 family protein [Rheinheimera gaetbuli]
MSNIKKYKVAGEWYDWEVTLEVDHDVLTPELANEINTFWSGSEDRADQENGSHVKAVIRFAGTMFINLMLNSYGATFHESNEDSGKIWTRDLFKEEGWPENTGIRVIAASVEVADYDAVELKELTT